MPEDNNNNLEYVAGLAARALLPIETEPVHYAIVPNDCKLETLYHFQFSERPQRKKGTATLHTGESFCEFFNRFKSANSVVFVDADKLNFKGVLNYHQAGDGTPEHGDFVCSFTLRETEPWKAWKANNAKPKSQAEFATFIEDNLADISYPPAATMRELSRDLEAHQTADFQQTTKLANGQIRLSYREEIKASFAEGSQEVPETFHIRLSVFQGQSPRVSECRLRFRIVGGKLTLWYEIPRMAEMLALELETATELIAEAVEAPMYFGTT